MMWHLHSSVCMCVEGGGVRRRRREWEEQGGSGGKEKEMKEREKGGRGVDERTHVHRKWTENVNLFVMKHFRQLSGLLFIRQ